MGASARRNDVISIAPILVRLSRILHNNGTATAVLAVPVPPPLSSEAKYNLVKGIESRYKDYFSTLRARRSYHAPLIEKS